MVEISEGSKKDLMDQGYDETAIEIFYDEFLAQVKKLSEIEPKDSTTHLTELLCN